MADVTTVFAAKDESFAKTVDKLQGRLSGFSGNVESFNSKVGSMASSFAKFAGPIAGVAAAFFGAKAAADAFVNALAMGGRLDDLTKRTGASAGEMLLLEKAFDLAGSSADAVGPTISKLNRFLAEASEFGSAQSATLRTLGLSYAQLAELSPSEQMRVLAERISSIESPALKTQAAMAVFGKSGGELIPLLSDFSGELSKAGGFLGSLPGIMDENAASFADLGDNIKEIGQKFDQFVAGLMTGLVPALTSVTDKLANLDTAGLGKAFSDYITSAAKAISNSYLLGDAIDNVKLAIDAILAGNYSAGLSLMWVTMKITALNAVNEIVKNFTAGLQAIGSFMMKTMGPRSALFRVVVNSFGLMALNFESSMSRAVANIVAFIPGLGAKAAAALRQAAEEARASADLLSQEILSGVKVVADEMTAAGAALPQSFADNKAALDPLFDLTDEFAEQKALQESITASIVEAQLPAEAIAVAGNDYADALDRAAVNLQHSENFSSNIALNLESAALSSSRIAPAFSLSEESSGQVAMDLQSTVPAAEQASEFLAEGSQATNALDINGRSYAESAAAAAASINSAKLDANITSNLFTGLSDRMKSAASATSGVLDQMREAFHFGKMTQEEISAMRKLEAAQRSAENARERAHERADHMEKMGQEKSAHNARMKADADFTRAMMKIAPELAKGSEAAQRALEAAAKNSANDLSEGGKDAGKAVAKGGMEAAKPIESAAKAIKEAVSGLTKTIATEKTLLRVVEFLKSLDKKLPQNALS